MIFIGIIGLVFLTDYLVKKKAEKSLKEGIVREVAGDRILLRKLHNEGIAFGWFAKHDGITVLGTAILLGCMLSEFFHVAFKKGNTVMKLGYALLIGGGLNNLYDRYFKGYVTDYFSFNVKWKKLRRLVFNLSDMFILIGTILITLSKVVNSKK